MTRSDLIEIIARVIGEHDAPDYVPEQWQQEAAAILSALSAAGLAVVPREATERMGFVGGTAFEDAFFANEKHVFDAAKDVWALMVAQAEFEQDRAMVAAEDLTG